MLKKLVIILLVLGLCAGSYFMFMKKSDYDVFNENGYTYRLNADNSAEIIKYEGSDEESIIIVPSYLSDYEVTSIARKAFNCENVTSIVISDTINRIEDEAFYKCGDVLSLTWPAHLLAEKPFDGMENLNELVISFGLDGFMKDLGSQTRTVWADSSESITMLTVEDGVRYLGNYCFRNLVNLQIVDLPDTVEAIGIECFYNDTLIQNIMLTSNLKSIGRKAFDSDSSSDTVAVMTVPQSVEYMGESALGSSFSYYVYRDSYAERYLQNLNRSYTLIDLSLSMATNTFELGSQTMLHSRQLPAGFDETVSFISLNQDVVTIDERGVMIAVGSGEATVRMQTRSGQHDDVIRVESENLQDKYCLMSVGESFKCDPGDFDVFVQMWSESFMYSTTDYSVASVSPDGEVTARGPGICNIYMTDEYENTVSYLVRVQQLVEEIILNTDSIRLRKGNTYLINASAMPRNAGNRKLVYESDNTNVAVVNSEGKVTALAYGDCTVTVRSCDGSDVIARLTVVVSNSRVSVDNNVAVVMVGRNYNIRYSSSSDDIVFSSSNENIATVDEKGTITGVSEGKCVVMVADKHKSAYSMITVAVYDAVAYGIDISRWNGNNLTADTFRSARAEGIDFVYIRAGYGANEKDRNFDRNYNSARAANMDIGAYHYIMATSAYEARNEANAMLKWIAGKTFEYPIMIDIEDRSQKFLLNTTFNEIINAYCEVMEKNGYACIVYSYAAMLNKSNGRYDHWVAHWNVTWPTYFRKDFRIWQFTDNGKVSGFAGAVDMDICFYDYPTYIKKNHLNGH
ncbi:MAG: Ig-like domain-containing protein [Erysipelotrichaceae bacterium]|nr:Ig-like domain-containing protein [Erysipelotrichaceae bacterium]